MKLKIISAGAGSGKTYRLTQEMVQLLQTEVRASGIIATTFTTKAAAELQERVRIKLLEEGLVKEANELTNALIGTVHGLGVKLLKRFAFLAGVSPQVDIIADEDQQVLFNRSLAAVLNTDRIQQMEYFSSKLGLNKNDYYDWRKEVKHLTDTARANDFSAEILEVSKQKSITSFLGFLGVPSTLSAEQFSQQLATALKATIEALENSEDKTKVTATAVETLKKAFRKLNLKEPLNWHEWVKISKLKVGAKSRDAVAELIELTRAHDTHPGFHSDIKNYLTTIFDIAIAAIKEYEAYKKQRGLIDYIDMEILVNRLLDKTEVQEILRSELDLLMVDEFQDTSPIQLEIFLKLSKIAKNSVWVGDPKQSIYGFRGAEPRLMMEIIRQNGGVKKEDIQEFSWRSREDIVHLTNALFTKAFKHIPTDQVALKAKRTKADNPNDSNFKGEPIDMKDALLHWHFEYAGEGRRLPGKPWMEKSIAMAISRTIERQTPVMDRHTGKIRPITAGDIAILCRTNRDGLLLAEALHHAGLKAAISRTGLLQTAEAKLLLACLKYILQKSDSLSVAEILLLGGNQKIEKIITNRLDWLRHDDPEQQRSYWGNDNLTIRKLNELRPRATELSSTEILNLLLETLDLRRIMAHWGNVSQRMDNVDMLRKFAGQYEENCNRLHAAASLGGFLLYLNELEVNDKDARGSGEGLEAVNILTYHRSKGLEWPMVICHNLENNLRDNLWGINIVAESEQVDLDNILAGRWLRYWINPYGNQINKTGLQERIASSPVQSQAKEQALEEEARLLYVGITRARDYLVLPTRAAHPKWLNRCWHDGIEDHPTLDPNDSESPWVWNQQPVMMDIEVMPFSADFPRVEPPKTALQYIEKREISRRHPTYQISADQYFKRGQLKIKTGAFKSYSSGIEVANPSDLVPLGKIIYSFFLADKAEEDAAIRMEMAQGLIDRLDGVDLTNAIQLADWSKQFYTHLNHLGNGQLYRHYPLNRTIDGQLFETTIDWLIIHPDGATIIQNTNFKGEINKYTGQGKNMAGWFELTTAGIQQAFKVQSVRTFLHFSLGGGMMEVITEDKRKSTNVEINPQQKLF